MTTGGWLEVERARTLTSCQVPTLLIVVRLSLSRAHEMWIQNESLYNIISQLSEIIRIGTFDERLGGVSVERIDELMRSGKILIPHIAITPSFVLRNKDSPPEIELKFECEPDESTSCDQWPNWQLHFLHNQLFEHLKVHSGFLNKIFTFLKSKHVAFFYLSSRVGFARGLFT